MQADHQVRPYKPHEIKERRRSEADKPAVVLKLEPHVQRNDALGSAVISGLAGMDSLSQQQV